MLVLSRKVGEAIIIAGGIRIVVVSSDKRGARIGIEAPATATILREELVQAVTEENLRASVTDVAPGLAATLAPLPPGRTPPDTR